MKHGQVRELFANASPDFLARNTGQTSKLEPDTCNASLQESKIQDHNSAEFLVCITSVRKKLLDEDNLCEKYHIDSLRYAGIIPEDSPDKVTIQTSQRQIKTNEAEHTEIRVYRLKPEVIKPQQIPLL